MILICKKKRNDKNYLKIFITASVESYVGYKTFLYYLSY